MSSFLQCSIELLNSYNFVKQKKCKRGLLKSKGSQPMSGLCFPPKFVEQPIASTWAELTSLQQQGARQLPVLPRVRRAPFYGSGSAVLARSSWGRGYQNQLQPRVWAWRALPYRLQPLCFAPSSSTAWAGVTAQPSVLLSPARAPRFLLAESTKQILGFSRGRREGLSISPCCSSTSCTTQACDIHHLPSLLLPAPHSQPWLSFTVILQHQAPTSSVFANSSATKPSPDSER